MIGQIQATNKSKSGKTIGVQVNDRWYTSKNWELAGNVGRTISFEPSDQTFPDGSKCTWLNDYKFDGDGQAGPAMPQEYLPADGGGDPGTTPAKPNKDALIGALALAKSVPGQKEQVWEAFVFFYHKLDKWNHTEGIPF